MHAAVLVRPELLTAEVSELVERSLHRDGECEHMAGAQRAGWWDAGGELDADAQAGLAESAAAQAGIAACRAEAAERWQKLGVLNAARLDSLGEAALASGDYDEAVDWWTRETSPEGPEGRPELGETCARVAQVAFDQGDFEPAVRLWERAGMRGRAERAAYCDRACGSVRYFGELECDWYLAALPRWGANGPVCPDGHRFSDLHHCSTRAADGCVRRFVCAAMGREACVGAEACRAVRIVQGAGLVPHGCPCCS
jgi:tetratricopeptide (TPR) repeat protein